MLTLATVQSDITSDIRANGLHIRAALRRAAAAGARLVHFPESALSGYPDFQVADWGAVDWPALTAELKTIAELARSLRIWVVLGSNHRLRAPRWPQNCLFVISDEGVIAGRYAKRFCSNTELTYWYTPGRHPLVFDVDGIRFGCALCIEVVFPAVFAEYERLGVTCILLSSYSYDPVHGIMARAHAATNCCWVSMSTPVACSRSLPATLFGPDGHAADICAPGVPSMLLQTIDPDAQRYQPALRVARPWRAHTRPGVVLAGTHRPTA